jgi:hypothetical protein
MPSSNGKPGPGPQPAPGRHAADSNPSLSTVEPVSVSTANSRREKVFRGQRPGRDFWRGPPISRDRDSDVPRHPRQSPGKIKAIPPTPGNRSCAGLRGGGRSRGRTGLQGGVFPASRENNREFRRFGAFSANCAIGEPAKSRVWRQNSLRRRAGNFFAGAGNFSDASGNFQASAGSAILRQKNEALRVSAQNSRTGRKNGNFALIFP